ncbi:MAG: efflux RND transporter periplasmic adaptor subunit [Chitinophagaceae bacterium]|jgi:HlyD family secretion protein|nr:efflux RND transporter periplasmic adaptor subunit [Chitinophagaceae bacterium]
MKKRTTFWIIGSLVGFIVLLIALKKGGVIGTEEGTKVAVEAADQRTIIETVNASGKIYPEIEVKISSDVSGEITELTVLEGDSVRRGQVLARVFADLLNLQQQQASAVVNQQQYQVANAEAQLEGLRSAMQQAQAQYDRQKKLLEGKVISRQEFEVAENTYNNAKASYTATMRQIDAAKAQVASARANLQRASTDVSRTTIVAPMDGVVSLLNVKKGERVVGTAQMAGTEMMRIADMSRLEVRVDVTENDIPKVHIGDSALISVDAYLNRKFKGIVYQIASSNNGAAGAGAAVQSANEVTNYKVYIRLLPASYADLIDPSKPRNFPFRPGMTASADIQTRVKTGVLSVPINAVTTRDKNEKKDGDAKKKEEKKGAGQDDTAPASSEEEEKDVVVFVYDKATNTVKKAVIKTGVQDTRYIEVVSGLQKGQQVVSEPYNVIFRTLKDGTKVTVVDKNKLFEVKD